MIDHRQNLRWKTEDYYRSRGTSDSGKFDVIDININQSIGQLVDINSDGMRLQSEQRLEKGVIFKLRIDLPEEIKGCDQLLVEARSLWSEQKDNLKFYHTGFEFLDKFQFHNEIIKILFEETMQKI